MQALFEFLPLILFLGAYFYKDIYFALGVLMVAMPIALFIKFIRTKKLDKLMFWSTVFLLVFGALTFYFQDPRFAYWKPTAFYWAVGVAFLASTFVGEKPLVRRFFDMAAELPTNQIADGDWTRLNLVWAAFFVAMGGINIYVAYNFSEEFWVKFKVFGLMGLTIVFMVAQTFWIVSRFSDTEEAAESEGE